MSYLLLKQNLIKVNIVSNVVSSTNWTTSCVDNTRNCYTKKHYNKCYNSGVHPLEPVKHSHRNFPFSPNKFWLPLYLLLTNFNFPRSCFFRNIHYFTPSLYLEYLIET